MLNLFKLPFERRNRDSKVCQPAQDLAHGIFRNYLSSQKDMTMDKMEQANDILNEEMNGLFNQLQHSNSFSQYDLMHQSLKRLDRKLQGL